MTSKTYFDGETLRDCETKQPVSVRFDMVMSPKWLAAFRTGVEAAIKIIEERGERIGGAVQPDRTIAEIRERLLG